MNTEYIELLIDGLKKSNEAIAQYNAYRNAVIEELKKQLSIKTQEELLEELKAKKAGSKTFKPYEGVTAKVSVEIKFDQAKITEILAEAPELIGIVAKTAIVPTSAKSLFSFISSGNKLSDKVSEAAIVTCRGPYLSLTATDGELQHSA